MTISAFFSNEWQKLLEKFLEVSRGISTLQKRQYLGLGRELGAN